MASVYSAAELFDRLDEARIAQDAVETALGRCLGIPEIDRGNPTAWFDALPLWAHFESYSFDSYDCSFELHGIPDPDWVPTEAQLAACFAIGFAKCWLNYADGTERYCAPGLFGVSIGKKVARHA